MNRLIATFLALLLVLGPLAPDPVMAQGSSNQEEVAGHLLHSPGDHCEQEGCALGEAVFCCVVLVGHCTAQPALSAAASSYCPTQTAAAHFAMRDRLLKGLHPETEPPPPRV